MNNGTFSVKSETRNVSFEYQNNTLHINGNYVKNLPDNTLREINGQAYRFNENEGETGDYVGSFNGFIRGDELKYTMSDMSRADSMAVLIAIGEIEPYVMGTDEE